jgi:hypothetical protein
MGESVKIAPDSVGHRKDCPAVKTACQGNAGGLINVLPAIADKDIHSIIQRALKCFGRPQKIIIHSGFLFYLQGSVNNPQATPIGKPLDLGEKTIISQGNIKQGHLRQEWRILCFRAKHAGNFMRG